MLNLKSILLSREFLQIYKSISYFAHKLALDKNVAGIINCSIKKTAFK